ncbi:uncharacterized protein J3D65DRAFT_556691 [Phyllosticta citribraziliensis]|uniref:DnaJ homologue subfamily C member 28 conserved domain-containing protein n=1 Tax=Phyllosticta citribraziliensis TaxID=989973 RepID=A0ABR1LEX6_9PEZI
MNRAKVVSPFICARCLRALQPNFLAAVPQRRLLSNSPHRAQSSSPAAEPEPPKPNDANKDGEKKGSEEKGAMTRRLEELTEEGLVSGGRRAQKAATEEAGFSEELKKELEERIANSNFRSEYASQIGYANLPSSAGKGSRDIAGAQAWTGEESVADASLRMLNDSIKPMRGARPRPPPIRLPTKVDTGRKSASEPGAGVRLANARDKTSIYAELKESSMTQEEKEKLRREMKERFQPAGRTGPMSIRALESMANERIEDAIARGQFRNIPRGKTIERDYNASNPFLDTTEYFMNKIIQKQEIVPPWIEKQQELVADATRFRARLRNDWKRHAARMIAAQGGSLEVQIRRARAYAEAEKAFNPQKTKTETLSAVDEAGHMSQITLAGELKAAPSSDTDERTEQITITTSTPTAVAEGEEKVTVVETSSAASSTPPQSTPTPPKIAPADHPFRDPAWEATEHSFLALSVAKLNDLTRSYNLMAPDLAKKPYFNLDRELRAAFADVAPLLAEEIHVRATMPKARSNADGGSGGEGEAEGFMERLAGRKARVSVDRRPTYGFKEWWRDLFGK